MPFQLRGKYINLYTFRRNGQPVKTTVLFYHDRDGGRVLVHTGYRSGKVKRIMRNPEVMIEEADIFGRPRGPRMRGRARVLEGDERSRALGLVTRCCLEKLLSYLFHDVLLRKKSDIVEIVPEDP